MLREVIQRRIDGTEEFNRTWIEYENGFGNVTNEFWLGNNYIHLLTRERPFEIEINVEDSDGKTAVIKYDLFSISDDTDKYRLKLEGRTSNAEDDCLSYVRNLQFSTTGVDNDRYAEVDCADRFGGGWWYARCAYCALNSKYLDGGMFVHWSTFSRRLVRTEMKIKPRGL